MSTVLIDKSTPGITLLTLNRPERRNALTIELMQNLCGAIEEATEDKTQRVLIFKGAGEAFCAGLDLREATEPEKSHSSAEMVARMLLTVSRTPLITIAAVHGAAVAGGAGLLSVCDFAIAGEGTRIGYPEVRRGLVAGLVLTFLRRQVKERHIREILLTGELITAARAVEIGLANKVVPKEQVEAEARKIAQTVILGAPSALANTKKLLAELWFSSVEEDMDRALDFHLEARDSEEAKEGIRAFLEKRPPRWTP